MDSSKWNFEENKAFEGVIATFPEDFEEAMAMFPDDLPDRWTKKIAETIEGKNQSEVCNHFRALCEDLQAIDAGMVELPAYKDDANLPEKKVRGRKRGIKNGPKPIVPKPKIERKKGTPWTAHEHMFFLLGLKKYPGGDWRSISRHCVKTRTPSQVASHAQKYYDRQNRKEKVKSRSSIHDIELTESDINELEQSMADPCAAGQCPDEVERPKLPPSATMLPRLEEEAGRMQMLPPSSASASASATATGIEWQSPQVQLPQSTIMPVGQSSQMNTIQLAPLPHSTLMCPQYEVTPGWMQMPGGHSNRMCPHYEQTAGWMHSSQVNTPQLPPLPHSTLMLPLPLPLPHYQENARQSSQLNTPQLPPLPHSTLTFPFPLPMPMPLPLPHYQENAAPLPHYQENAAPTQMPIPTAPPQLPHYNGASFNYGDFW